MCDEIEECVVNHNEDEGEIDLSFKGIAKVDLHQSALQLYVADAFRGELK